MNGGLFSRTSILFGLSLFSLTQTSLGEESRVHSGFYGVSSKTDQDLLGSVVFLHEEDYLPESSSDPSRIVKGIRGVFGKRGEIWDEWETDMSSKRTLKHRWSTSTLPPLSISSEGVLEILEINSSLQINLYSDLGVLLGSARLEFLGRTENQLRENFGSFLGAQTRYIAHRGSPYLPISNPRGIFPSNTWGAFDEAIQTGYAGIELDVYLSQDHQMVVSHDQNLAVSSTCEGQISKKTVNELDSCLVIRSGLFPESKFGSNRARVPSKLSTLRQTLERYLDDSRLEVLVVDVKPGDITKQAQALQEATLGFTPQALSKLIFLVRTDELTEGLRREGLQEGQVALEGPLGWEPLDSPDAFLDPTHDAISLSLGLGLGLNGFGEKPIPTFETLWHILKGLPLIGQRGGLDIGLLGWTPSNFKKYRRLLSEAHQHELKIIAWTVNTAKKIKKLRRETPDLDYLLSDLSYSQIARLQLLDLIENQGLSEGNFPREILP